jgi:hypothetical protein
MMRDRRVPSILVTVGLIASLILPTSVSFAASPKPTSSDPNTLPAELLPLGVRSFTASA